MFSDGLSIVAVSVAISVSMAITIATISTIATVATISTISTVGLGLSLSKGDGGAKNDEKGLIKKYVRK